MQDDLIAEDDIDDELEESDAIVTAWGSEIIEEDHE